MFKLILTPASFHQDIAVIFFLNSYGVVLDSYYLAIDNNPKYGELEGYERVYAILKDLFIHWREVVATGKGFLTLDFSDQYIAGFKVESVDSDKIKLEYIVYRDVSITGEYIEDVYTKDYSSLTPFVDKDFNVVLVNKNEFLKAINDDLIKTVMALTC